MQQVKLDIPTLVLGAGIAGSGKTTILKEVVPRVRDSLYVQKDSINDTFLMPFNHSGVIETYVPIGAPISRETNHYHKYVKFQTYHSMLSLAKDNLLLGKHPMLDGNYTKEIRAGYIEKVVDPFFRKTPHRRKIVFCHAPESVIRKRLTQCGTLLRDADKLRSARRLEKFIIEQPPLPLEIDDYDHIKVNTAQPIGKNIKAILAYLQGG